MNLDDEANVQDSGGPIDILAQYFSAHGWSHEQDGDEEVVAT